MKINITHQELVQLCDNGMLQRNIRLLAKSIKGLCVAALAEVLKAEADGLPLPILGEEFKLLFLDCKCNFIVSLRSWLKKVLESPNTDYEFNSTK